MNSNDHVGNDEELYRAVLVDESGQCIYEGGRYTVRSKAFLTPDQKPSVGRAELSENDPALYLSCSQLDRKNGVVSYIASSIREIELDNHSVEVKPAPLLCNPAHAQIVMKSKICVSNSKRNRVFGALRSILAKLATNFIAENGWARDPQE